MNDLQKSDLGVHTLFFWASVFLFLVAMLLPSFYTDVSGPNGYGVSLGVLALGWIAVFEGEFRWLINPLLMYTWYLYARRKLVLAICCSLTCVAVTSSLFVYKELPVGQSLGESAVVTEWGAGFWCWFISQIMVGIACFLCIPGKSPNKQG